MKESYAREQFLLLEREAVIRINRAAFAGMWINKPLMGQRIDIPQGAEIIFFPYYFQDFIRISFNDTVGYMSSAFYVWVGLPPYFQEARERACLEKRIALTLRMGVIVLSVEQKKGSMKRSILLVVLRF
ncbi:MAG: hypothetical protein CM1200mP10_15810 [Candidatus Neomarinimicrobiota bacterium]|nr:MAG: hypothetical protein CM1200mP10_15810 [Candidatus Neomarinimicrobiota bacterium]